MIDESEFRQPTERELALLARLLEADFPGRDELAHLISNIEVKTLDAEGGLELKSKSPGRAPVVKRIPVEAEAKDVDGLTIHVLLHVIDGRPAELEVFKDDSSQVEVMPPPSVFELIVLPPAPHAGS